jgi:hypothetical protein
MKMKQVAGMGLLIPKKMRIGGMTFYKRQGQVIGRVSESMEKRSNTLPQFKQRQKMRHATELWKMLRFCETMFTERGNAYQNFASLSNRLPVVYVERRQMGQATFLMPGIPVSDGTMPALEQHLGEVDGTPALITNLRAGDMNHGERLWLYTAEQYIEGDVPRVRFSRSDLIWQKGTAADGQLILKGDEYADPMKGWALVRVVGGQCSPQTIVTRCTLYEQYTTEEALQIAAKSYGGLTETPFPSPR